MWAEVMKVLGTIVVAALTAFGSQYFGYKQFILKRQDEKEEKSVQNLVDNSAAKLRAELLKEIENKFKQSIIDCGEIGDRAILKVQEELQEEIQKGLAMRSEEGRERFEVNSRQIEANTKQLAENSKQIEEILGIVKDQAVKYDVVAQSLAALNATTATLSNLSAASAEAHCNSNYDRLLMVTNKVLKAGKMTISDKTNIKQLYKSWLELGGKDMTGKLDTLYDECMKMPLSVED